MSERWLPLVGLEGRYSVSDLGRVRCEPWVRVYRTGTTLAVPARILKTPPNKYGYPECRPNTGGNGRTRLVHHLVLEAFVGPKLAGMVCCHNDGNPGNAVLSNLRWDTMKANSADAIRHGVISRGEDRPSAKLTAAQVRTILADDRSQYEIAKQYGVDQSNISRIKSRQYWSHL